MSPSRPLAATLSRPTSWVQTRHFQKLPYPELIPCYKTLHPLLPCPLCQFCGINLPRQRQGVQPQVNVLLPLQTYNEGYLCGALKLRLSHSGGGQAIGHPLPVCFLLGPDQPWKPSSHVQVKDRGTHEVLNDVMKFFCHFASHVLKPRSANCRPRKCYKRCKILTFHDLHNAPGESKRAHLWGEELNLTKFKHPKGH